jgi:hypothetical protein
MPVSAAVTASEIVSRSRISQSRLERRREARRVETDLALADEAALVGVHELDRILDRDDVPLARAVDLVDERGERGRLARAGRSGAQEQPLALLAESREDAGKPEIVDAAHVRGNHAQRRAHPAQVTVHVHAKARQTLDRVREVDRASLLECKARILGHDFAQQRHRLGPRELPVLDAHEITVQADARRIARNQVQVGPVLLHQQLKKGVDSAHRIIGLRGRPAAPAVGR